MIDNNYIRLYEIRDLFNDVNIGYGDIESNESMNVISKELDKLILKFKKIETEEEKANLVRWYGTFGQEG